MKILGIDPGSIKTGWSLFLTSKESNNKIKLLESGTIITKSSEDFLFRLKIIYDEFESILTKHRPDQVALESLIYVKNPTSLMKLAQTRGVFLACLFKNNIHSIFEYAPTLVKSSLTGHGHATKENMQMMLSNMLKKSEFSSFDESDSMAVALCHILQNKNSHDLKSLRLKQDKKITARPKNRSLSSQLNHKIN